MVLEHGQRTGGIGGGIEPRKGERERNGKVAAVPLNLTMMGLYYPAVLPVSSPLQQSSSVLHSQGCKMKTCEVRQIDVNDF